ncbi:MAG TPA: hypothetical protein PLJ60_07485 [Chryseolinea sp.]|nr:hypothetical protein [Chryseolinea sp.]
MASLINSGTAATKAGDKHIIHFYVDGTEVAYYHSINTSISAGGMQLACAQSLSGKNWLPSKGTFKIVATVETIKDNDLVEGKNSCEAQLIIPNGKVIPIEIATILKQ